jgi:hypothetical protein
MPFPNRARAYSTPRGMSFMCLQNTMAMVRHHDGHRIVVDASCSSRLRKFAELTEHIGQIAIDVV